MWTKTRDRGRFVGAKDDFQWLADKMDLYFPLELREQAIGILAEAQEGLEEAERDRQRRHIRELSEELWRRKEGG